MANVIYKITNLVNNKCYIGKTKDLNNRWKQHKQNSKKRDRHPLYDSMRHHGLNKFKIEILQEAKTYKELDKLEQYYIVLFDSINNGYNITDGGTGGDTFSNNPNKEYIRKKHSKNTKRWASNPENKKILSQASKHLWEDAKYRKKVIASVKSAYKDENLRKKLSRAMKDKCSSKEYRKKMSKRQTGNKNSMHGVHRFSANSPHKRSVKRLSDGKVYATLTDAVNDTAISWTTVWLHCNNKCKYPKFQYVT